MACHWPIRSSRRPPRSRNCCRPSPLYARPQPSHPGSCGSVFTLSCPSGSRIHATRHTRVASDTQGMDEQHARDDLLAIRVTRYKLRQWIIQRLALLDQFHLAGRSEPPGYRCEAKHMTGRQCDSQLTTRRTARAAIDDFVSNSIRTAAPRQPAGEWLPGIASASCATDSRSFGVAMIAAQTGLRFATR